MTNLNRKRASQVAGLAIASFVAAAGTTGCTTTNIKKELTKAGENTKLVVDQRPSVIRDAFACTARAMGKAQAHGRPIKFQIGNSSEQSGMSSEYMGSGIPQAPHHYVMDSLVRYGFKVGDATTEMLQTRQILGAISGIPMKSVTAGKYAEFIINTTITSVDMNSGSDSWNLDTALIQLGRESQVSAIEVCSHLTNAHTADMWKSSCNLVASYTSEVFVDRSGYNWNRIIGEGQAAPGTYGAAGGAMKTTINTGQAVKLATDSTILNLTSGLVWNSMPSTCKATVTEALLGEQNVVLTGKTPAPAPR